MELPQDYQKRIKELLGDDYDLYLENFARRIGQTFRVNQLKTEPAELFRRLYDMKAVPGGMDFRPVPWCPTGAYYRGEERLSLIPYYHAGLYYIQEPSAMAPAAFLPVSPGDRVLDLCAAPGGKTTALGARMEGRGLLMANDISISRCKALLRNVEASGIQNAVITCETPEKLAGHFPSYFDAVLVDAPCSGEGMFRKDPGMMKKWSVGAVAEYSMLQKDILSAAAVMVRPGGHILYSTCTYSPEENEQVVETLLADGEFELLPLPVFQGVDAGHPEWSISGDPALAYCRRFWNHRVEGEGQFAALMRKKTREDKPAVPADERSFRLSGSGSSGKTGSKAGKADHSRLPEEYCVFASQLSGPGLPALLKTPDTGRLRQLSERVFLLPEAAPDMSHLRVVSSGLYLGSCRKKRFEPGHALAMALSPDQYANSLILAPDDERVGRYLRCETIELREEEVSSASPIEHTVRDGWCLICLDRYPLGWGKVSRGRIKNKYPPGWRIS